MALAEELSGLSLHWPHRPPGPARQHPLAFLGTETSFLGWESWGQKSDPRGLLQSPHVEARSTGLGAAVSASVRCSYGPGVAPMVRGPGKALFSGEEVTGSRGWAKPGVKRTGV